MLVKVGQEWIECAENFGVLADCGFGVLSIHMSSGTLIDVFSPECKLNSVAEGLLVIALVIVAQVSHRLFMEVVDKSMAELGYVNRCGK